MTLLRRTPCVLSPVFVMLVIFVTLVTFVGTPALAAKSEPFPHHLQVDIRYDGTAKGPESWREELEAWLIDELDQAACFLSVRRLDPEKAPESFLELEILVANVLEEQQFNISQATLYDPDRPPDTAKQYAVRLEAEFDLALKLMPQRVTVRSRRSRITAAHRPVLHEDPRYEARQEITESLYRMIRAMTCKGSEKKLSRAIEKALAQTSQVGPGSR